MWSSQFVSKAVRNEAYMFSWTTVDFSVWIDKDLLIQHLLWNSHKADIVLRLGTHCEVVFPLRNSYFSACHLYTLESMQRGEKNMLLFSMKKKCRHEINHSHLCLIFMQYNNRDIVKHRSDCCKSYVGTVYTSANVFLAFYFLYGMAVCWKIDSSCFWRLFHNSHIEF